MRKTLEEEFDAVGARFHRLAALIVRKKFEQSCGDDHEWRETARGAVWAQGGYQDEIDYTCLVCGEKRTLCD